MTEPATVDPRALRALLVEDSRLDAELLRVQLDRVYPNVELQVLRDEGEFCDALAARSWDVILSDYELPGFTGAESRPPARSMHLTSVSFPFGRATRPRPDAISAV